MEIKEIIEIQREYFSSELTLKFDFRVFELKKLKRAVKKYEPRLQRALLTDLGRNENESYFSEIEPVYAEIDHALDKVWSWMRPHRVKSVKTVFPTYSKVYPLPKGIVLIMPSWHNPVYLSLSPLISAIMAGNCVVINPVSGTEHVSAVLRDMFEEFFACKYIAYMDYPIKENDICQNDFDHIVFAGSKEEGQKVARAAITRFTSVTLLLGGKSPCIVDDSADIDLAAKKIIWGKCIGAGQSLIAPDYVLLHSYVKSKFFAALKKYIVQFYGDNPLENPEYSKIIDKKNFERLVGMIDGDNVVFGGRSKAEGNKIEPTIIDACEESLSMKQEICGPVLPVITVNTLDEAYEIIKRHPDPPALYLFTKRKNTINKVVRNISFGGGCINNTLVHGMNYHAPFGGIGHSGYGNLHGKSGFDSLSHYKTIVNGSGDLKIKYPLYADNNKKVRGKSK